MLLRVKSSKSSFRSICCSWKCSKQGLFRCHFGIIWIIYQECSKRWFRWRHVNRLTLHFTTKAEIVTNGLLKMCPRLEPQQHFEAACCHGKASLAVARISCVSVRKMRPRQVHRRVGFDCVPGLRAGALVLG